MGHQNFLQFGTQPQLGDVSQVILLSPEDTKLGQISDSAQIRHFVIADVQLGQFCQPEDRGDVRNGIAGGMQNLQLFQIGKGGQIHHRIAAEIQLCQLLHGGKGLNVPDGVVLQIQIHQSLCIGKTCGGGQTAILQGKLLQLGKGADNLQFLAGYRGVGYGKGSQLGHTGNGREIVRSNICDGQLLQVRQVSQVAEILGVCRNGEGCNGPQVVGIKLGILRNPQAAANSGFHSRICKFHQLNHTAYGVAGDEQRTDQTVFPDGEGIQGIFSVMKRDGLRIGVFVEGGVFTVGVDANLLPFTAGIGDADVLIVEAGLRGNCGHLGTQSIHLGLDFRIADIVQKVYGIQKLVLLHIGFAQGDIKVHACAFFQSMGEHVLSLGVVAVIPVLLGKLNRNGVVVADHIISAVIKPGRNFQITLILKKSGTLQQNIPGKGPVKYKEIPCGKDDNHQGQGDCKNDSQCFFHFRLRFEIICN